MAQPLEGQNKEIAESRVEMVKLIEIQSDSSCDCSGCRAVVGGGAAHNSPGMAARKAGGAHPRW